ncbi:MAG: FAD-dependent oxidoreductase [Pseudomonadota bacterium]
MPHDAHRSKRRRQLGRSSDILIVGAGIFGLSVAWAAKRRGLSVRVLEAEHVGAGASGGIVGALTPHAPSRWRPLMAFQFDALVQLEAHIAELESFTDVQVGYARSGRLTPLATEKALAAAQRDVAAVDDTWGKRAEFEVLEDVPSQLTGWIRPEAAPFGLVRDTISARVDPRAYLQALAFALPETVLEGETVTQVDAPAKAVVTHSGRFQADFIVLTAGWQVWSLARQVVSIAQGQPVKGQAAMFAVSAEHLPLIYQNGLYVIPHSDGRVAVGSTSEKVFEDPFRTDGKLDEVIDRAREMSSVLKNAPVVEHWAGLRPKPPGREPIVGPLTSDGCIWIAAGGFKISFGIAHAVADAIVEQILGENAARSLPHSFDPGRFIESSSA